MVPMTDYEDRSETLRATLERTAASLGSGDVTLRALLREVGDHGPLLLCALLTIPFLLPVSIPGVSTVFGVAIILLGLGVAANRLPWLPGAILDRGLDAARLKPVLERGIGVVARIETVIGRRLEGLTDGSAMNRLNGLAIVAAGILLMFPLGLVPFSNTLPAFAILFLALGMTQRDGAFVLAGYGMLAATVVYFSVLGWLVFVAGRGLATLFAG
jgi:hypothetical protein